MEAKDLIIKSALLNGIVQIRGRFEKSAGRDRLISELKQLAAQDNLDFEKEAFLPTLARMGAKALWSAGKMAWKAPMAVQFGAPAAISSLSSGAPRGVQGAKELAQKAIRGMK